MPTSRPHPKSPNLGGFTLAELLVVILLFALALPAFINITGASKLDAAANAVHSATWLARQYALTHNQPTYIVFNEGRIDPSLAYRACVLWGLSDTLKNSGSWGSILGALKSSPWFIYFLLDSGCHRIDATTRYCVSKNTAQQFR